MPWCPKCGTEYEEGVQTCVDCHIALVDKIEDIVDWAILLKVKSEEEVSKIKKYLNYSHIERIKSDKDDVNDYYTLSIPSQQLKEARKYMSVYLSHELDREDVEYLVNEYETEPSEDENKIKDSHSSMISFGSVGVISILVGLLNMLNIISIPRFNSVLLSPVLIILGLSFIWIAISSYRKYKIYQQTSNKGKSNVDEILQWFNAQYTNEALYSKYLANREETDEGAQYFILIDELKTELVNQFPQADPKWINTAAERVYDQLISYAQEASELR